MLLLSLLAVGLLSLSTISLRTSASGEAMSVARGHARLALQLAIGQLQTTTGSDTRITAPADVIDSDRAHGIGAWRSWEGGDHDRRGRSAGRPIAPDYGSKRATGTPMGESDGRFLGWLVTRTETPPDVESFPVHTERRNPEDVRMLGEGPSESDAQVHVPALGVGSDGGEGRLAWWVSGENQKARIQPRREEDEASLSAQNSDPTPDPEVFRLSEDVEKSETLARLASRDQFDIVRESDGPARNFHHLSATSTGLLTNSATGGWRKDLTLLTQHWDEQPSRRLELFKVEPDRSVRAEKAGPGNVRADRSILYPWASYRSDSGSHPIYQTGPVASWSNLVDYCMSYRRRGADLNAGGRRVFPVTAAEITNPSRANTYTYLHETRLLPVIARVQWVYSLQSEPMDNRGFNLSVILNPVVTMWNPYDVEMRLPADFHIILRKPLPSALKLSTDSHDLPFRTILESNNPGYQSMISGALTVSLEDGSSYRPGETRVYSPEAADADNTLIARPGYHPSGGYEMPVMDANNQRPLRLSPNARIRSEMRFDAEYTDLADGIGIYLDAEAGGRQLLAYRMTLPEPLVDQLYGSRDTFPTRTVAELGGAPRPFASCVFGTRIASDTHLPAKGFVQSSPLVSYTATGNKSRVEHGISRSYNGATHPVNSPFDFSFLVHTSLDNRLPNAGPENHNGYIVSGFDASSGLARAAVASIPSRPLQSLAELQHWDLRQDNPVPPFAFNLIGNADASPLLPPDAVVNASDGNLPTNLQHDDSYCANHLLFDDWFFSTIHEEPDGWQADQPERSERAVFTDLVNGDSRLANPNYRFALPKADAEEAYETWVAPEDAWRNVAACLEVDGMFNVNSTSADAWRALLRHARDEPVPRIDYGGGWSVDVDEGKTGAVSRATIAGDNQAGDASQCGGFPGASEFTGYRVFDDDQLDELAVKIVEQVRARGPFLSLSEFVNRQLSSGELALAGTVQTALNELASDAEDPFSGLKALSSSATSSPPAAPQAGYRFPAAAEGYSAYGLPGWTRQADILRPLAPSLTVRDDTFTIRAYGEARGDDGQVTARAWCEATIRRQASFVDPADPSITPVADLSPLNQRFGRHYRISSFRWLARDEL